MSPRSIRQKLTLQDEDEDLIKDREFSGQAEISITMTPPFDSNTLIWRACQPVMQAAALLLRTTFVFQPDARRHGMHRTAYHPVLH